MDSVGRFAGEGGPVVGICNGFQVLTEAGLLPGALMRNDGLRFLCTTVSCQVESTDSVLTRDARRGAVLQLPINHYEGNFTCSADELAALESNGQVVLRYLENPNGSTAAIAGVANRAGNVVGLMPHPERASEVLLGSLDGLTLLESLLAAASQYADQRLAPAIARG
jgi:phosphoribosylformylglycinamidine synthase